MITEKQKHLIFDINCFYQLESQKDKFLSGQPVDMLPELGFVAMAANRNGQTVNWQSKYNELSQKLKSYGLSDNWVAELKAKLKTYTTNGKKVEQFRIEFMTPIDLLVNFILGVLPHTDPSIPKEAIAEGIIGDVFDKNYWQGETARQVNIVRTLSTSLRFDKNFVVEFGKALVRLN